MTRTNKIGLSAGVSALALTLGLASTPAAAFDKVYWGWNAYVHEYVDIDAYIDVNLDPTGMTMLEDLQVFIGDVRAESYVHNIYNYQGNHIRPTWDMKSYGWGNHNYNRRLNALAELPEVVSAATAVGNNTNIETDTSTQLHEGQFVIGDADFGVLVARGTESVNGSGGGYGGNTNLEVAGILGALAILGAVDTSNIDARSKVNNILNATVDSSATAVANNLSVDVAATGDDRVFIGDVVQFAVADVTAKSEVYDIRLNNYARLGEQFGRPIVNSIATAVGNNKSITVRAPVVNGVTP